MNKKYRFSIILPIVAGVLFFVVIGFFAFGGLSFGVKAGRGTPVIPVNWSTNGLKDCVINLRDRQDNQSIIQNEELQLSGSVAINDYDVNGFVRMPLKELVRGLDELRNYGLPADISGNIRCKDYSNNDVILSFRGRFPRPMEPPLLSQLKSFYNFNDNKVAPTVWQDGMYAWNITGASGCNINWNWNWQNKSERESEPIPNSISQTIGERDIYYMMKNLTIRAVEGFIRASAELRELLPLDANAVFSCKSRAGEDISFRIKTSIPRISEPLFISELRSFLNGSTPSSPPTPSSPSAPRVDLRVNNSNGPIRAKIGERVNISWSSTDAVSCVASIRNNTTGQFEIRNESIGLSGSEMERIRDDWAGDQIITTVTCDNSIGYSVSDDVIINVKAEVGEIPTSPSIPSDIVGRLNKALIKVMQGMLRTLNLLMQRPNDPVVNEIIGIFNDLVSELQGVVNDLNQLQ